MVFDKVKKEHILQGIKEFGDKDYPNGFGPSVFDLCYDELIIIASAFSQRMSKEEYEALKAECNE